MYLTSKLAVSAGIELLVLWYTSQVCAGVAFIFRTADQIGFFSQRMKRIGEEIPEVLS
jgi:hypothetical protein